MPKRLQRKFFFELMLYFFRRGQEHLKELKKECFLLNKDPSERQYAVKLVGKLKKIDERVMRLIIYSCNMKKELCREIFQIIFRKTESKM